MRKRRYINDVLPVAWTLLANGRGRLFDHHELAMVAEIATRMTYFELSTSPTSAAVVVGFTTAIRVHARLQENPLFFGAVFN